MIFPKGTIRVVSPVTEDGNRVKIDPQTDRPVYREDFFPLTAKRLFEEQNNKLPQHLRKKIEVLQDGVGQPKAVAPPVATEPVGQEDVPERKKPGPKPKEHAQSN
jgi:hypothetical protein